MFVIATRKVTNTIPSLRCCLLHTAPGLDVLTHSLTSCHSATSKWTPVFSNLRNGIQTLGCGTLQTASHPQALLPIGPSFLSWSPGYVISPCNVFSGQTLYLCWMGSYKKQLGHRLCSFVPAALNHCLAQKTVERLLHIFRTTSEYMTQPCSHFPACDLANSLTQLLA